MFLKEDFNRLRTAIYQFHPITRDGYALGKRIIEDREAGFITTIFGFGTKTNQKQAKLNFQLNYELIELSVTGDIEIRFLLPEILRRTTDVYTVTEIIKAINPPIISEVYFLSALEPEVLQELARL